MLNKIMKYSKYNNNNNNNNIEQVITTTPVTTTTVPANPILSVLNLLTS